MWTVGFFKKIFPITKNKFKEKGEKKKRQRGREPPAARREYRAEPPGTGCPLLDGGGTAVRALGFPRARGRFRAAPSPQTVADVAGGSCAAHRGVCISSVTKSCSELRRAFKGYSAFFVLGFPRVSPQHPLSAGPPTAAGAPDSTQFNAFTDKAEPQRPGGCQRWEINHRGRKAAAGGPAALSTHLKAARGRAELQARNSWSGESRRPRGPARRDRGEAVGHAVATVRRPSEQVRKPPHPQVTPAP